jgi:23S rRNA (uridine2552-2'-O)-methyltransferase
MGPKYDVGPCKTRVGHAVSDPNAWMRRHVNDPFVQAAQKDGYLSRAAYKLHEIQEKDKIFKPNMTVVDLGAAPGGWSQVTTEYIGKKGRVIAIDLLPMGSLPGVEIIQGDFNDQAVIDALSKAADGLVDIILSDMAPNLSGQRSIDMPRSIHLLELALDCAQQLLKPGGTLLVKAFQGAGLEQYIQSLRACFKTIKFRKPAASRATSKELYVLAQGFKREG